MKRANDWKTGDLLRLFTATTLYQKTGELHAVMPMRGYTLPEGALLMIVGPMEDRVQRTSDFIKVLSEVGVGFVYRKFCEEI